MTSHFHAAYGLVIDSEIPLPELTSIDEIGAPADVHVRLGSVPDQLEQINGRGVLYEVAVDEFLLKMPDIARYWVRNGNEIVIEPALDASEHDIRVFMLGSCVGALLHQREMLVLHAAAIGTDFGSVLFAGPSGMGKSTLLGAMLNRGYSMMVDDVCGVVGNGSGGVEVLPGYPRTRVWADAAEQLHVATDGLDRTRPALQKFERQLPGAFWNERAPMRRLYILASSNSDELRIDPLPRVRAFTAVLANTYRRRFLDGFELQGPHFALASSLAASVRVATVVRPAAGFRLAELADLIEADMHEPDDPEVVAADPPDEPLVST